MGLLSSVVVHADGEAAPAFDFTGHVVHVELEGGFWAIQTDDQRKLDPTNLPPDFRVGGLRVHGTAVPRPDAMSFHMWGTIVELRSIEREK